MSESQSASGLTRRRAVAGAGLGGALALLATRRASGEATSASNDLAANKALVEAFYAAFYGARTTGDVDAIDAYVSPDYIQHEPGVPPGRAGLKELIQRSAGRSPEPPPLLHLIAEGDIVVAHQIVPGPDPARPLAAEGVDIFRIAGGRLAEHWGVDASYDIETGDAATPTG